MNKTGIDVSWPLAKARESQPGSPGGEAVEAATAVSDIPAAWPRGDGLTAQSWRLYG